MSRVLRQDVRGKERGKEREEEALREEEKLERRFVRYKRFPNGETEQLGGRLKASKLPEKQRFQSRIQEKALEPF